MCFCDAVVGIARSGFVLRANGSSTAEENPMRYASVAPSATFKGGSHLGRFNKLWCSLMVAALLLIALTPGIAGACACGCGVFEVATPSLIPDGAGGTAWVEYDYMDQYINWHATRPASETQNNDKKLETNFVTLGGQYMFNHQWGAMLEVPYWQRNYTGAYNGNNGDVQSFDQNSVGDIRLLGVWTGLSEDMSTGLLAGFKVP